MNADEMWCSVVCGFYIIFKVQTHTDVDTGVQQLGAVS